MKISLIEQSQKICDLADEISDILDRAYGGDSREAALSVQLVARVTSLQYDLQVSDTVIADSDS